MTSNETRLIDPDYMLSIFILLLERDEYKVSLMNGSCFISPRIQHKIVLLVYRPNCIIGFLITQFLAIKLLVKIPLQIGDIPSALFLYFCVNVHESVSVRIILRLHLTNSLCSELYGHDWFQTCTYKTKELWGLFVEVREKSVVGFRSYLHFFVKARF